MKVVGIIRKVIKENFAAFSFFYDYLGYRVILALGFSLLVGTLDGFGLSMFLPLLQITAGNPTGDVGDGSMGNMSFILDMFVYLDIPVTLPWILMVMMFFFVLKAVFKLFEGYNRVSNQHYFVRQIRYQNIDLLASLKYKAFVQADSGRIQNTLSGEVERVITAYRMYFSAIQYGVLVFVYLVLAVVANPQFAMLVVIGGGLTNFLYRRIYVVSKRVSREVTEHNHTFQRLIIQMVSFFKYLKATGVITTFAARLKATATEIESRSKKIGRLSVLLTSIREPIVIGVVVSIILIHVNVTGQPLGLIILSLMFFYRALSFLMNVQSSWNIYLTVSGSLENLVEFSDELRKGTETQGKQVLPRFANQIEFRDVGFNYGETRVLHDISLIIRKNEVVALVGESGSGKSTLLNLVAGLILPDRGEILIDGVSIREADRLDFQKRLGYITQDPVIFSDSIYNNITLWKPDSGSEFTDALKLASIDKYVDALEQKELTMLDNNGITVSGGQRQRLSIARELFKEVDILLLDEATSALDTETERAIQQSIESLKGKYTIVMIAHRLSTVKNADRIILLNKGRIEAVGSFEELTGVSDKFKRMVQLQEF